MISDYNTTIGYFEGESPVPSYNPPPETTPCPICNDLIDIEDMITVNISLINGFRSYFFRKHRWCVSDSFESVLIDSRVGL